MSTTYLLHNVKEGPTSNYDMPRSVYARVGAEPEALYTFDGVYMSVYQHRELLKIMRQPAILFVTGKYVGGDNSFDEGQPREYFASWQQLIALAEGYGAEIAWHTWRHPDLTQLSDTEILREITPPAWLACRSFAYPYGRYDDRVRRIVAERYERAFTAGPGTSGTHELPRRHIPKSL